MTSHVTEIVSDRCVTISRPLVTSSNRVPTWFRWRHAWFGIKVNTVPHQTLTSQSLVTTQQKMMVNQNLFFDGCQRPINCCIPHGSVLGPQLFILYINDLANCSKPKIRIFADDTTIKLAKISNKLIKLLKKPLNPTRLVEKDHTKSSVTWSKSRKKCCVLCIQ